MSGDKENTTPRQERERAIARDKAAQTEDQANAISEELTKARKASDMAFKARQAAESVQREAEHKLAIAEAAEERMNAALARMNKIENFMVDSLAAGGEIEVEVDAGEEGREGVAGADGVDGSDAEAEAHAKGEHGEGAPAGVADMGEPGDGKHAPGPGQTGAPASGSDGSTAELLSLLGSLGPISGRPADEIVSSMGQLSTLLIGTSPAFASAMRVQTDAIASGMAGLNSISNQQSHYTLDLAATARAVAETYAERTPPIILRAPLPPAAEE